MNEPDPISDSHTIELGESKILVTTYRSGKILVEPQGKVAGAHGIMAVQLASKDPGWQSKVTEAVEEMKRKIGLISKIESESELSLDFLRERTPKAGQ